MESFFLRYIIYCFLELWSKQHFVDLLKAGLGSHCRRALAPAPAPELSSAYPLAPAPALQLFNKQVVYHLVFKSFLP